MAASASDLLMEVGTPGTATTLSAPGYTQGNTSITVGSTANWPTATGVVFAIDRAEVVNGEEVRVDGTYCEFVGTVASGTSVTNVALAFGTPQDYSAGSLTRVYIPVSSERENRIVEWGLEEHTQTGTHVMDRPKVLTSIDDTNGNELLKVTATGSAVNELTLANAATGNPPALSATGGDSNIGINLVPKGTGALMKSGFPIDWFQELGRTTLSSTADTISVASLPSRKYLMIWAIVIPSGTIDTVLKFNNDSGSNYAWNFSTDLATLSPAGSQTSIPTESSTSTAPVVITATVENIATREKWVNLEATSNPTGAANAPTFAKCVGKWANTTDAISRVDLINTSTGDFAAGTELIILGSPQ